MKTQDIKLRYRPFRVKYHGPANVRGSRVSIHDLRHGTKITLGYDDRTGDSTNQAATHLEAIGIKVAAPKPATISAAREKIKRSRKSRKEAGR